MNKFLRISFVTGFIATLLSLLIQSITGCAYPIWCYIAIYTGTLLFMLNRIVPSLEAKRPLLQAGGIVFALLGNLLLLTYPVSHFICNLLMTCLSFSLVFILKYNTIHRDFASKFKFSLVVFTVIYIVFALFSGETGYNLFNGEFVKQAISNSIPFLVITLAMGVLLLRGLRASSAVVSEKEFNRRQLRDTLIFFGACVLVWGTRLLKGIELLAKFLFADIIIPLLKHISDLLSKVEEALVNHNPVTSTPSPVKPTPYPTTELTPIPELTPSATLTPGQVVDNSENMLETLMYIVLGIAVAFVLFIILTKLLKQGGRGRDMGYPNETSEDIGEIEQKPKEKPLSRRVREPRLRLRFIYSEFMTYVKRKGGQIMPSDTCSDIESNAKAITYNKQDDVTALSEAYRKARYNLNSEVTAEDVKEAKKHLNSIKD